MNATEALSLGQVASASARGYLVKGFAVIFLVLGGLSIWAGQTHIAGAVVSSGVIAVESKVKKVQHPTGGVVSDIRVANGAQVKAGDLLIRLDETVHLANLQLINRQLDELAIRAARLQAERDGAPVMPSPGQWFATPEIDDHAARFASENAYFQSRRQLLEGQKQQLSEQESQLRAEISGSDRQLRAKRDELAIVQGELSDVSALQGQGLVTSNRANQLRRDAARLEGEVGQLEAAVAQAKGRVAEIGVESLRLDEEFKTATIEELRDNLAEQAELIERRIAALDQLKRVEIRAPQSGTVHELAVHTLGGVIHEGEPLLLIVPEGDDLIVEARIATHDIEMVHNGDGRAFVRLPAFDHQTTPELEGRVIDVSADVTMDPFTGAFYYLVRVAIPEEERARLGEKRLLPGMPAEVFLKTHDRTILSYLMKPMMDQISRAFRER